MMTQSKPIRADIKKRQESIGSRIAKAVNATKKISERIFGYIPYDLSFVKASYNGTILKPTKITALEKVIIGILLVDKKSSFKKIGTILGLDVVNDIAEESILRSAINILKAFHTIVGDDECLALTNGSQEYSIKGERPETYSKIFDIFVDLKHPQWLNIKNGIGDNIDKIGDVGTLCDDINLSLDQIKSYAENQDKDVHCPQNRHILQDAVWNKGQVLSYKVYVCFVQNIANSNDVRAFVYDENNNGLNDIIAQYINSDEVLKSELLNDCIHLECENDDITLLEGGDVDVAKLEIPEEIKHAEQEMIDEDLRDESEDDELHEVEEIDNEQDRLHKKPLYDSLSFEVELQKMFNEDDPDEIWLISPWIRGVENNKHSVFIEERGPAIENFLKDDTKRVFVAYSAPSVDKNGNVRVGVNGKPILNIDEDVKNTIDFFEEQYPNFFFAELPEFHVKNVIEVKGSQKILFSGSFNVLSFSVSENQTHIRREEMALAHYSVVNDKHRDYQYAFACSYVERIEKQIESLSALDIDNYCRDRLDYFLGIKDAEIHKLFSPLEDRLEEKKLLIIKSKVLKLLDNIEKRLEEYLTIGGVNNKDKMLLSNEIESIERNIHENSIEDPTMLNRIKSIKNRCENIPVKQIFPSRNDQRNTRPLRNLNPLLGSEKLDVVSDEDILNIIRGDLPTTERELMRLLVMLFYASSTLKKLIRKGELQNRIKQIIESCFNLYSEFSVNVNNNTEDAIDVTMVADNHSFIFRKLYIGEISQYDQYKKINSVKRYKFVTNHNIESVVLNVI